VVGYDDLLSQRRPQPHIAWFDSSDFSDGQQKAVDPMNQMSTGAFWLQAARDNGIYDDATVLRLASRHAPTVTASGGQRANPTAPGSNELHRSEEGSGTPLGPESEYQRRPVAYEGVRKGLLYTG
jgi:hypothetical protein